MSVPFYSVKVARFLLSAQLMVLLIISLLFFALAGAEWGLAAIAGGMVAWLPNILFMFFACRFEKHKNVKGKIVWSLALGGALKMVTAFIIFVVAVGVFGVAIKPLGLAWLSVLAVQILAPVVINNEG